MFSLLFVKGQKFTDPEHDRAEDGRGDRRQHGLVNRLFPAADGVGECFQRGGGFRINPVRADRRVPGEGRIDERGKFFLFFFWSPFLD